MAENWVKYPVSLGTDLKAGRITKDEFLLISYMLSQCDRETGIIVTNSRLLAIETDQDRKRVANLLSSLKKKSRIQSAVSGESTLSQKRGNTKPYDIRLCDALPNNGLVRDKSEASQSLVRGQSLEQVRGNDGEVDKSQSEQGDGAIGTDVAPERDLDLDLEGEQNKPEQFSPSAGDSESKLSEVDQFIKLLKGKHKLPSDPIYGTVNHMVYKYGIESSVAAMEEGKPTSNTWSGILAYYTKIAATLSAQSRGVSGEKLDKLEAEYRELYYEVTEYREYFDANEKDFPEHERKESAKWLDRNESKLAMARYTIEENGGSLEVRR